MMFSYVKVCLIGSSLISASDREIWLRSETIPIWVPAQDECAKHVLLRWRRWLLCKSINVTAFAFALFPSKNWCPCYCSSYSLGRGLDHWLFRYFMTASTRAKLFANRLVCKKWWAVDKGKYAYKARACLCPLLTYKARFRQDRGPISHRRGAALAIVRYWCGRLLSQDKRDLFERSGFIFKNVLIKMLFK